MKDVLLLTTYDEMAMVLQPLRYDLLRLLREPMTAGEAAGHLGVSCQRVYYHVRKLLKAGFVEVVGEHKAGSAVERVLQATAEVFMLSDEFLAPLDAQAALVGRIFEIARTRAVAAVLAGESSLRERQEADHKFFLGQWQLSPEDNRELVARLDALEEEFWTKQAEGGERVTTSVLLSSHLTSTQLHRTPRPGKVESRVEQ